MAIHKNIYIDLETGGLNSYINPVLQIAGLIEVGDEVKERFNFKCKPMEGQPMHPKALEVIGYTQEQILEGSEFESPELVFKKFKKILESYVDKFDKSDKFYFYGYNTTFDEQFLRKFWSNNGDTYYGSLFHFPSMDVAMFASEHLKDVRHHMKSFKLVDVAERILGDIDTSDAHDAMWDIETTYKVMKTIKAKTQP